MFFYFFKLMESCIIFILRVDRFMDCLVLVFYCMVICFFCIMKKVIFSWLVDFKNYILKRYKEIIVLFNVFEDIFFFENNCFWIFFGL